MDGRLSLPKLLGNAEVELEIFRSQVRRPNQYTAEPPKAYFSHIITTMTADSGHAILSDTPCDQIQSLLELEHHHLDSAILLANTNAYS